MKFIVIKILDFLVVQMTLMISSLIGGIDTICVAALLVLAVVEPQVPAWLESVDKFTAVNVINVMLKKIFTVVGFTC